MLLHYSCLFLTVFLEAINLLDDQRIEHNHPATGELVNEIYGSRYFLGVRARL